MVQRMVFPEAAGIMFTADPVTSNRRVTSIDAGFGLGEAFVSGLVNADNYRVRDGRVVDRKIATQTKELRASPDGGTEERPVEPARRHAQTLSDERILRLERLGRRIEAHFGRPQDIEWGLADGEFHVLQSRPITTLYPVPPSDDGRNHVYISYGHRQMMTDAFTPLGLSFFQLLHDRLGRTAGTVAGNRFYRDLSHELASPVARAFTLRSLDQVDVLMARALRAVLPVLRQYVRLAREDDPGAVPELVARNEATVEKLRRDIAGRSGDELFAFIVADHDVLAELTFDPRSVAAAFLGIQSVNWVNKHMEAWLGEKNAADAIARRVVEGYLRAYGMHCQGDIDITRTRWSEDPTLLVPLILGDIRNFPPGERPRKAGRGRAEAERTMNDLLERLRRRPGGARKARKAARKMSLVRHFIGYREYSKHALLQRHEIYKRALLAEARRLAGRGVVEDPEDVYFLSLEEFGEVVNTGRLDRALVTRRREEHEAYRKLTPPRVITSEGEVISGEYDTGSVPKGALPGIAVSSGVVEGRARVVRALEDATRRIRDGQLIRVNGTEGYVELLPER
ncbi:PEP/pyruvate-binding domain-containing protein [Nonomuraea lactucae]|uniref:PEP/pyruvate-binding domain-containing protein n=1 Tax=Nonomuraea lactucae TaxID=2249762 RepID=UPI001F06267B|nr:PEP/pyruvate-binding domain-containing protein [Nonomuraea lactucae]